MIITEYDGARKRSWKHNLLDELTQNQENEEVERLIHSGNH